MQDCIKKVILKIVEDNLPSKKKTKYSNEQYLDDIFYMFTYSYKWAGIKGIRKNVPENYHKTVNKKFIEWSRAGIFMKAHEKIVHEKAIMHNTIHTTLDLIIDSTEISNKKGCELAKYGKNKKKKVTKISCIYSPTHDLVYDIRAFPNNVHDVNTLDHSIESVIQKTNYRKINLIGDKGYISKKRKAKLAERNISLIYPNKTNMKNKNTCHDKEKLSIRHGVERLFAKIKSYVRITLRYDRLVETYMSMWYIGLMTYITMPTS